MPEIYTVFTLPLEIVPALYQQAQHDHIAVTKRVPTLCGADPCRTGPAHFAKRAST